jgi:hypothetical protein
MIGSLLNMEQLVEEELAGETQVLKREHAPMPIFSPHFPLWIEHGPPHRKTA